MKRNSMPAGRQAFTLVELLVVIAIIGLLSTVAVVALGGTKSKARDAKRKLDLKQISTALELYYGKYQSYPSTSGAWWSACNAWTGNKGTSGANGWVPSLAPEFMGVLPLDPMRGASIAAMTNDGVTGNTPFCYIYNSDGTDYKVAAHCGVENGPITSGMPYYTGHDGWGCSDYNFAVYTPGAAAW